MSPKVKVQGKIRNQVNKTKHNPKDHVAES